MNQLFDILFGQYATYSNLDITFELIAVVFGLISVLYAKANNILVYPTGIISTLIFVYLLLKWSLLGDMMINAYYFIMSIYGWYIWTRKKEGLDEYILSATNRKEKITTSIIFIVSFVFVTGIYLFFDKFNVWTAYIDTLTTAIFFSGMWLMTKRKIENWIFWIIGDIISVPLYFYKGYTFTSIQYVLFTIFAIMGYLAWKKSIIQITKIKLITE